MRVGTGASSLVSKPGLGGGGEGVNEASQTDVVSRPRPREEGEQAAGGEEVSGRAGVWWREARCGAWR